MPYSVAAFLLTCNPFRNADLSVHRVRLGALVLADPSDGLTLAIESVKVHPGYNSESKQFINKINKFY